MNGTLASFQLAPLRDEGLQLIKTRTRRFCAAFTSGSVMEWAVFMNESGGLRAASAEAARRDGR